MDDLKGKSRGDDIFSFLGDIEFLRGDFLSFKIEKSIQKPLRGRNRNVRIPEPNSHQTPWKEPMKAGWRLSC